MFTSRLYERDARDVLPADPHLALVGTLEPGDQPQRRRLPASGRAEQRQELTRMNLEVDRIDRRHRAEALRDSDAARRRALDETDSGRVSSWVD